MNAAFAPFFVLGLDIFGHENNPAVAANQFVFWPVGLGLNQGKIRAAVGRRYLNPAHAVGKALFSDEFETQLFHVEPLTYFQIPDENDDVLNAQVGLFASRAKHGTVRPRKEGIPGHRRDYKSNQAVEESLECNHWQSQSVPMRVDT